MCWTSIPRDMHTPRLEPIETRLEPLICLEESSSEQFQAPQKLDK